MKSLLTFLSLLAVAQAAIEITDYKPKGTVTIKEEDNRSLTLTCKTYYWWYHCQFHHETNGKSCKIDYDEAKGGNNVISNCQGGIKYKGDYANTKCIVEIENVGIEDAGEWTMDMQNFG